MDFILRSDQGNYLLLLRHILWAFLVNILISCDSMLIDLTSLQCPYFTKFCLTIETVHRADNGTSENVSFFESHFSWLLYKFVLFFFFIKFLLNIESNLGISNLNGYKLFI